MKIGEIMTRNVRTVRPDSPVQEAARIMSEVNCGAVPVVENDRVVGIITDRDITLRVIAQGRGHETRVSECMSANVITCGPETDAHECANQMARRQIRRLPVVENGRLVGICALGDLATVRIHVNEAGDALSSISEPARPGAH